MTAIKTDKLTKKFGDKTAVDCLDLTVEQGEHFALLGVNGAGKSTVIRMLCCLIRPTSGDALMLGHSIKSEPAKVKELINLSPQDTAVARNLNVRENLDFICGMYGFDKNKTDERVTAMIDQFDLSEVLRSPAGKLSGGWQRRLSIAMALITSPQILFLDEPTLGLDILARRSLWKIIDSLTDTTVILTTHYLEEAEHLSHRLAIMDKGAVKACGTSAELKELAGKEDFEEAFIALCGEGGDLIE